MICPKCGFVQDEETECGRCGIIFVKYHVTRPKEGLPPAEPLEETSPKPPAALAGQNVDELGEMRQEVQDLSRRFNELEFERVERNRMRAEMRARDQKLEDALTDLTTQAAGQARQIGELAARPIGLTSEDLEKSQRELSLEKIDPILQQLSQLAARVDVVQGEFAERRGRELLDLLLKLEERQNALEAQLGHGVSNGTSLAVESFASRLNKMLEAVDGLRASLEGVTARYSEIGELKKGHLHLSSRFDTLEQHLRSATRPASDGPAPRIAELEGEVKALRAEVQEGMRRIEGLEAAEGAPEVQALEDRMAALSKICAREGESLRATLGALDSKLRESIPVFSGLSDRVETLATQIQRVEQQYQSLATILEGRVGEGVPEEIVTLDGDLPAPQKGTQQVETSLQEESKLQALSGEPVAELPYHGELRAIRENMEEIRRFMLELNRKLGCEPVCCQNSVG